MFSNNIGQKQCQHSSHLIHSLVLSKLSQLSLSHSCRANEQQQTDMTQRLPDDIVPPPQSPFNFGWSLVFRTEIRCSCLKSSYSAANNIPGLKVAMTIPRFPSLLYAGHDSVVQGPAGLFRKNFLKTPTVGRSKQRGGSPTLQL